MTEFVASNGNKIRHNTTGLFVEGSSINDGDRLFPSQVVALREFFQAERDADLGRWRSKEHPEYVVYVAANGLARVLDESDGRAGIKLYKRGGTEKSVEGSVAQEFFAAHPEPKQFPSEPGAYNDAHGILTTLDPNGVWRGMYGDPINPDLLALPLIQLVPKEK